MIKIRHGTTTINLRFPGEFPCDGCFMYVTTMTYKGKGFITVKAKGAETVDTTWLHRICNNHHI
jgi:hypothetical protein